MSLQHRPESVEEIIASKIGEWFPEFNDLDLVDDILLALSRAGFSVIRTERVAGV
jgi:hypothetical protein